MKTDFGPWLCTHLNNLVVNVNLLLLLLLPVSSCFLSFPVAQHSV